MMQKYNILIVEDNFINAQFLKKAVIKLGHHVIARVKTGVDAINIVTKEQVHIIFMDINLEGSMDGITCATKINQSQNIPIIYTTAYGDSKTIDEATDTNLFGYLIKPFDYADIESVFCLTIKKNYSNKKIPTSKEVLDFHRLGEEYKYFYKSKTLMKLETPIDLTNIESKIFYYLFIHRNKIVSNELLGHSVWNNINIASSTLRNSIFRLRKKVPNLEISTLVGIGYMLKED
jgi:DNA-binding response OmpR family regulator